MSKLVRHTHEHFHAPEVVDCYQEHNGGFTHVGSHVHEGLGPHNHDGQGHTDEQLRARGEPAFPERTEPQ